MPVIQHAETTVPGAVTRNQSTETTARITVGGFSAEALAGAATLVLAILALVMSSSALYLASVATIALGAAFLLAGIAVASRFNQLAAYPADTETVELGTGVSAELVGGAAGIALGILALLQIAPVTLLSVAIIVLGGTLLLGSATTFRLGQLRGGVGSAHPSTVHNAVYTEAGAETLVGIGAIVLGILAITEVGAVVTLISVALLALGAQTLLSGIIVSGRMAMFIHH
ncbi:MAG: hypothetical protein IT427_16950 [Pirellulales bacterium]|nr:hypothetical protein [Pirellulales bacterium]